MCDESPLPPYSDPALEESSETTRMDLCDRLMIAIRRLRERENQLRDSRAELAKWLAEHN